MESFEEDLTHESIWHYSSIRYLLLLAFLSHARRFSNNGWYLKNGRFCSEFPIALTWRQFQCFIAGNSTVEFLPCNSLIVLFKRTHILHMNTEETICIWYFWIWLKEWKSNLKLPPIWKVPVPSEEKKGEWRNTQPSIVYLGLYIFRMSFFSRKSVVWWLL